MERPLLRAAASIWPRVYAETAGAPDSGTFLWRTSGDAENADVGTEKAA